MIRVPGVLLTGAGLVWLLAAAALGHAEDLAGGPAAYLREGLGSRSLAMGNAGTSAAADASAAYWNPADLLRMRSSGVASQTGIYGLERTWNFINYAQVFGLGDRRFAAGLSWLSFSGGGDLEARSENRPDPSYMFSDSQNAFYASLGLPLGSNLRAGANIKLLFHSLDESRASGPGLDFAVGQTISPGLTWGLVIQDAYTTLTWSDSYAERVPTVLRGGASGRLLPPLILATDLGLEYDHPSGKFQNWKWHAGAEYQILSSLFVRAGLDNLRWTAGAGWQFPLSAKTDCRLDYALAAETLPGAGLTHLFSLVLDIAGSEAGN